MMSLNEEARVTTLELRRVYKDLHDHATILKTEVARLESLLELFDPIGKETTNDAG